MTETSKPPTKIPISTTDPELFWDIIQIDIKSVQSNLQQNSDGYLGLADALEQGEPNEILGAGIAAGAREFQYLNEEETADVLITLMALQGC